MLICLFFYTLSVVTVPGYGTPPVKNWDVKPELEKAATNVDSFSRLHMYVHEPTYGLGDRFTWENFLESGSNLAEDLAKLSEEASQRQLTFSSGTRGRLRANRNPQVPSPAHNPGCSFSWRSVAQEGKCPAIGSVGMGTKWHSGIAPRSPKHSRSTIQASRRVSFRDFISGDTPCKLFRPRHIAPS